MGMGAPQGGDAAVQIIGHGQLFAGGLGVKVHQCEGGLFPGLQQAVRRGEGVVAAPGQVAPADEHQHRHLHPAQVIDPVAPARSAGGEVGRAENVAVLLQIIGDLHFAPGVVAQGDDVGPGGKQVVGLLGGQAGAGDVLAVDNGEVHALHFFKVRQMAAQVGGALLAGDVADGQNAKFHGRSPFYTTWNR